MVLGMVLCVLWWGMLVGAMGADAYWWMLLLASGMSSQWARERLFLIKLDRAFSRCNSIPLDVSKVSGYSSES
jgi:hypothetical protein